MMRLYAFKKTFKIYRRLFFLLILVLPIAVNTADTLTINFIKSFIENERKPTDLIHSLCWPKHVQINTVTELSRSGIRSSVTFTTKHKKDHKMLFLLDLDCPNSELTIEKATRERLFRTPYRWLVLTKSSEVNPKMKHILDSPILADSDFVLAERNGHYFRMTELHKPARAFGPIVYTNRGFYNGTLVDVRPRREVFQRRKDVMGNPLIMSVVIQDSNTTQQLLPIESRTELQYDSIAKIGWSNAKTVFEMLNSTPAFFFSHSFGYKINGTWSGMINDLDIGRADVGTNCQMTLVRLEAAVFTDMMTHIRFKFIFRQPPLSFVTNIFSLAFSAGVWIALVVCAAFSTLALFLSSRHEANLETSPTQLDGGINDSLLMTFSAVSQQGCVVEPKKLSGRIVVWALFTAYMALYAAYSANIVVLLQAPSGSIKTLSQLVNSKIRLAALDVNYNRFVFRMITDPLRVGVVKKIEPEKGKHHYYSLNEGVEKIRQGMFAFHCIVNTLYKRIEETFLDIEKCDLTLVDFAGESHVLRPLNKNSPYLELFKVTFQRVHETGVHSVHVSRFQVPMPRCNGGGPAFSSVGIGDTMPVIYMMLCGFAIACIIMLLELFVFRLVGLGETMPDIHVMLCGFAIACVIAVLELLVFRL